MMNIVIGLSLRPILIGLEPYLVCRGMSSRDKESYLEGILVGEDRRISLNVNQNVIRLWKG